MLSVLVLLSHPKQTHLALFCSPPHNNPTLHTVHRKKKKNQCTCNIVDSKAGESLSFCVDGTSLHLVMSASNAGRRGIGFRVVDVPFDKRPNEKDPYRSVAHVLCGNIRTDTGQECKKKVQQYHRHIRAEK